MRTLGNYIALNQIETDRAEKYFGASGITIDLSIGSHSTDNVFWTNTMFECPYTGDKVFVKPQAVAEAFGSFSSKKNQGEGYVETDGTIKRFFDKNDIQLRISPKGEYIPKEGTCIVEKIKKPKIETSILLLDSHDEGYYEDRFLVRYVGALKKKNRNVKTNASTEVEYTQVVPRVGSVVVTSAAEGLPLFSEMNMKLDKQLFVVNLDSVLGEVMVDGSVFPLGDRLLVHHEISMKHGEILLTKLKQSRCKKGVVLARGPECVLAKAGDSVVFGKNFGWNTYKEGCESFELILREQELLFVNVEIDE